MLTSCFAVVVLFPTDRDEQRNPASLIRYSISGPLLAEHQDPFRRYPTSCIDSFRLDCAMLVTMLELAKFWFNRHSWMRDLNTTEPRYAIEPRQLTVSPAKRQGIWKRSHQYTSQI
jgi:hypothetical protein